VGLVNSSKSDDLRTNAFSTSTKCESQGKNIFWICSSFCYSYCFVAFATRFQIKQMNKLFWWLYFIISQRFAHLFKWASSGQWAIAHLFLAMGNRAQKWAIRQGNGQSPTYSSGLLQGKQIFWICWSPLSRHYKKLVRCILFLFPSQVPTFWTTGRYTVR